MIANFRTMANTADRSVTSLASYRATFLLATLCLMATVSAAGELVINEILTSNQSGLMDEDGENQDWIEIVNRSSTPINLSQWSLSDDPNLPDQWTFPSRTLAPGEYLVVFASGKDRKSASGTNRFHANFKLSGSGEFLGLYSPGQPRVLVSSFSPEYPEQRNDTSFGPDPEGSLRYFAAPTPGVPNGESTITGAAEPVHCSIHRGHFTQPFDLILSCPTPGVIIRYTLDGSEPTASTGFPYYQPLRVTNTTLFRAAAFRAGLLPSHTETHSYLFNLTPAQRSLPILSIVTATNHLYGRAGILGMGGGSRQAGDNLFITNNPATDFHNPSARGLAWERPSSLELIQPHDNSGFQVDCGLRVQGSDYHRPRLLPTSKFSFGAFFRGDYGPGRLRYPFFPLTALKDFNRLVLRGGANEPFNPFVRDELTRRLLLDMGHLSAHGALVNLFTNGGYAGYYNPAERIDAEMLQSHLGGSHQWDVVNAFGGVIDGDRADFAALVSYITTQSAASPSVYQEIMRRLDLVNFVDYLLLHVYASASDWPANNFVAYRNRRPEDIWRFIAWDGESTFGADNLGWLDDTFAKSGSGYPSSGLASPNSEIARMYQSLRASPEFRLLWADRIHKQLFNGGALTDANITNRFAEMRNQMLGVFDMIDFVSRYNTGRRAALMPMLNTYGLYGFSNALYGIFASSNAPVFSKHGGSVVPGFSLTMTAPLPGSAIYYTTNGDDPRVMFTGAVSNSAVAYAGSITLNQSMRIRARALWQGTNWSALNEADFNVAALGVPLRLTELNYNPTNPAHEFLEIQNIGGSAVDLSGMTFEGVTFTFGVGATLAPGARLVLVSDFGPAEFAARYPGVAVSGYYSGNLNNGGERIALKDRNGNYIFTVDYDDAGGWPTAPDGGGTSLELTDVFGDPDDPANWHASTSPGGSPGGANSSVPAPAVRLSEVLAENGGVVNHNGTFPDYVEIQNTGGGPVNLAGWSLTDDGNARKFVFPSTSIPAGGYLTVWCDDATNTTPGLHTGFSLQRGGDNVYLFNASSNLVDAITFGLQLTNHSVGRVGGEWVLNTPTPNADNAAAGLAAASSLSINEWQASAPPGQSDWIELHNTAAQPVALRGCYLSITTAVHRITSLSFVPAFGFVQLFAAEGVGPDHLDFRLNAAGATIVLHDAVAAEINRVTYTNAVEGLTRGRLPDGTASIVNFPGSASPGASNYVNTYTGAVINEVLARNRSAVTNAGNAADYIELFNPTGTPFSLLGMSLSVDSAKPGQYVFLAGASVPANGHLVIWWDGSRPASFGPADYNTGRSLDGESGGVYLFNSQGQVVNSVEYGFQVIDRPIGVSGGQWRLLASATPGVANAAPAALGTNAALRINEWMANPAGGPDWFELFNTTNLPVELGGLYLTDDPSNAGQRQFRVAPLSFIGPSGFVQWIADGDADQGRDHVNFSLDASGESIWLFRSPTGTNFTLIDSVAFDTQQRNVSEGRLPDGQANITAFPGSATPGESNYLPTPGVVINEVLTHTDAPLEDAVELSNTGASAVNLGGWYLSDSQDDFKKYRIPDGTTIAAGGFAVFYQNQFGAAFTFDSAHGDEAWLSAADANGNLTGYRTGAKFGAAENGVSFGRVVTSVGVDYVAMSVRTFGQDSPATLAQFRTGTGLPNAAPLVGPVIISELMYHPQEIAGFTGDDEYIELRNLTGAPVLLFDPAFPTNRWKVADGVDFTFPPSVTLPANGFALVVPFDPADAALLAAFRSNYGVSAAVLVFGPYIGKLDNAGENIELLKPDAPQPPGTPDAGFVPYVLVDRVDYRDAAPWPAGGVDGGGLSLQQQGDSSYGNEPLNWRASMPTPGVANGIGIVAPPFIASSPQTRVAVEGDAVSLTVTASGAGLLGYQWRLNGTDVPGATNATLQFDFISVADEGDYDCLVSNPGGAAISARTRISVLAPPEVLIPPASITNRFGSNVVFTVIARGSEPLHFQWRLNGVNLSGETNASLLRNNIRLADDGEYDVLISNPVNTTIMAAARLLVLIDPVIVQRPVNQTIAEGTDFTMSVEVTGNPAPFAYSWRRGISQIATNFGNFRTNFVTLNSTAAGLILPSNTASSKFTMILVVYNQANPSPAFNSPSVAFFTNTVLADFDRDGIPDIVENQLGLSPTNAADAALDIDGDGLSNRAEYLAGTDPTNALSVLKVELLGPPAAPLVTFPAMAAKTYSVQYRDSLGTDTWLRLAELPARSNSRIEFVPDLNPATNRFYRVTTPARP